MAKKRQPRLVDMYRTGKPWTVHEFDPEDPTGDPVGERKVWLEKLSGPERQKCVNRANAARAAILAATRGEVKDAETPTREALYQQVLDMGDDMTPLVDILAHAQVSKRYAVLEAQLADDDTTEWGKDGYLEGLRDAWQGDEDTEGLSRVYALAESGETDLDPALVERAREVFAELARYDEAFGALIESELDGARRYFETMPAEELRQRVVKQFIEEMGDLEWNRVHTLSKIFYSVREFDERDERHFRNLAEVEATDDRVLAELIIGLNSLELTDTQAKSSRRPRSSSAPSGRTVEEGASTSSGQALAPAADATGGDEHP